MEVEEEHWTRLKSPSGDTFIIPPDHERQDIKAYKEAVKNGDDEIARYYEEGNTGWVFIDE
jgi:hypothetical protein